MTRQTSLISLTDLLTLGRWFTPLWRQATYNWQRASWRLRLMACVVLILNIGFMGRLAVLYRQPEAMMPGNEQVTEAQQIFQGLLVLPDLVQVDELGRLILPAEDWVLHHKAQGMPVDGRVAALLSRLHFALAGQKVQQEVGYWNQSRQFAALREWQGNDELAAQPAWQAQNAWQQRLGAGNAVPLAYGYVNDAQLQPGFADWLVASGEAQVWFEKTWTLSHPQRVSLQIIGQPDWSGVAHLEAVRACPGPRQACVPAPSGVSASAYHLILALPAGETRLRLPVRAVSNPSASVDGVSVYRLPASSNATEPAQRFAWRNVSHAFAGLAFEKQHGFHYELLTQDGQALLDAQSHAASNFTQENGLLPVVGYDTSDSYALAGLLDRSNLGHDGAKVHLTLDSRLQGLAYQRLRAMVESLDASKQHTAERKAAVVLMNPHSGAILAAVNYPNPPSGVNRWDRLSFSLLYSNLDPFKVTAWQGLNNHYTPGSTFKPVTALAAIRAEQEGRQDVQLMLQGLDFESHWGAPNLTDLTGLTADSTRYAPNNASEVSNFDGETLGASLGKPLRAAACAPDAEINRSIGLREAIRDSSNIWFARLGQLVDEPHLVSGGDETYLAKMADELGFGSSFSLTGDEPLPLRRLMAGSGQGDVLNAFTGGLTLHTQHDNQASALQRLVQNSFGQGVAATPLQMARLASVLATGALPQPYLLARWDGRRVQPVAAKPIAEPGFWRGESMANLQAGLKAVVETGTAARSFNQIYPEGLCQVYGKTGTAQVAEGNHVAAFNSAWFVGWHVDAAEEADLSFACMVTHTYENGKRNGGEVCAPVIAGLLHDMQAAGISVSEVQP